MDHEISLGARLTELAELHPHDDAIVFAAADGSERVITWAELERGANNVAWILHDRGVGVGSLVGIGLPKCLEHFAATFGAWKAGATVLSMSAGLPPWERTGILESIDASAIIADWEDEAGALGRAELNLDGPSGDKTFPALVPSPPVALCSGGSTGRPKVVMAPGSGTRTPGNTLGPIGQLVGLRPRLTSLVTSPLYHNLGFYLTYLGVFDDNRTIVLERFDAARVLDLVESQGVQWMSLVPTMMQRIINVPGVRQRNLASIERIIHTAAPCPAWLKEAWIELLGPERICEVYSSSEQVGFCVISGDEWLAHRGSVGQPVFSELRVLDDRGERLPAGQVGELFMRVLGTVGPAYEYAGSPRGRVTADGFASIGDLGWVDDDGYVYLADRRSDLIISGGANVYPAEVEAALGEHAAVADVAVIGLPDQEWGQRVHAVLEASPESEIPSDDALREFCEQRLDRYKVPRSFEWMGRLPRNDAGKIRRSALAQERHNKER